MGTPPAVPLPMARLLGVGAVVFFANAALLVLQLIASRLLSPFIGSDLYTWTSIIGVFLAGIALGNVLGGRLADRYPTPKTLTVLLALGAAAAAWMVVAPRVFHAGGLYKQIPLGPRIPLLAAVLCLPAGFVLSLLTPVSIRLGLPDVSKTGRITGTVFALSTLGCLLGNYATGFYLIPAFTINTLVLVATGVLAVLAVGSLLLPAIPGETEAGQHGSSPSPSLVGKGTEGLGLTTIPFAFGDIRQAYLIVFLASFGGMALELTAFRMIAQQLGVSLFTTTGVIGVMLAGTALGNFTGGVVADRANRPGSRSNPRFALAGTLVAAGAAAVFVLVALMVVRNTTLLVRFDLIGQVVIWTFIVFFMPMFVLGMVSPQVIRLAVPDIAHVGRVAGRVYAWSTGGAIAGTFATGYLLLSTLGAKNTVLVVALVLIGISLVAARVWERNMLLYLFSIALGGVTGGLILNSRAGLERFTVAVLETNYYTIKVSEDAGTDSNGTPYHFRDLHLDHLLHSSVNMNDPTYFYYEHEYVQIEFLRAARAETAEPRCLVIGGGGYTFPRGAQTLLPESHVDVVEIDPGVTRVAREHLGLQDYPNLTSIHMDGRQFVAERAAPGSYDLVVQDAVNDLSVPAHLLTKEYNDAVKGALKPGGVYLLTVIDSPEYGRLWRSALRTLRETFPHVALITNTSRHDAWWGWTQIPPDPNTEPTAWSFWAEAQQVLVIYASDRPLDPGRLFDAVAAQTYPHGPGAAATHRVPGAAAASGLPAAMTMVRFYTRPVPEESLRRFLDRDPGVLLTDQYAPVDNLMADVFRRR